MRLFFMQALPGLTPQANKLHPKVNLLEVGTYYTQEPDNFKLYLPEIDMSHVIQMFYGTHGRRLRHYKKTLKPVLLRS